MMLRLCVRSGAVRAVRPAGGDHVGWTDDVGWRAAAAGRGPRLSDLEGSAWSRSRSFNAVPQLRVRTCVFMLHVYERLFMI